MGCEILGTFVSPREPCYSDPLGLSRKVGVRARINGELWGLLETISSSSTDEQIEEVKARLIHLAEDAEFGTKVARLEQGMEPQW